MFSRVRKPGCLRAGPEDGQDARCAEGRGAIAAELGGAGHLTTDAGDVAKGLIEVIHCALTLQLKLLYNAK
jgi:hypothetical protein